MIKAYVTTIKSYLHINNIPENVNKYIIARQDPAGRLCFCGSYENKNKAIKALKVTYNGVLLEIIKE